MTSNRQQFGRMCALLAVAMLTATTQVPGQNATTAALRNAARSIAAGNLESAERELQSVLRNRPGDYRALDLMGIIRVQQHREPEAEEVFQQAIRRKPDFASARALGPFVCADRAPGRCRPAIARGITH